MFSPLLLTLFNREAISLVGNVRNCCSDRCEQSVTLPENNPLQVILSWSTTFYFKLWKKVVVRAVQCPLRLSVSFSIYYKRNCLYYPHHGLTYNCAALTLAVSRTVNDPGWLVFLFVSRITGVNGSKITNNNYKLIRVFSSLLVVQNGVRPYICFANTG